MKSDTTISGMSEAEDVQSLLEKEGIHNLVYGGAVLVDSKDILQAIHHILAEGTFDLVALEAFEKREEGGVRAVAYGTRDLDFDAVQSIQLPASEICTAWLKECKPDIVGIVVDKKSPSYKVWLIVAAVVGSAAVGTAVLWYWYKEHAEYPIHKHI